ncbi:hypothetical protein [Streptomyces chattanoogensis]|uniref:Uncharacterized protein n=1 Tax=Streptomyces chattanoogensis TaxID=66876 RepID=A0A0N0XUB7_9ACTN|nr:hypothetical protein [Streptomyces chattanoogensis]KPC60655.1 hypothetical protein ADL29_28530 [Streptomyces chattanoogensis]
MARTLMDITSEDFRLEDERDAYRAALEQVVAAWFPARSGTAVARTGRVTGPRLCLGPSISAGLNA